MRTTLEDELNSLERKMKGMQARLAGVRRKWVDGSAKHTRDRNVEEAGS